jgi:ketosteroid isomerase-like protein
MPEQSSAKLVQQAYQVFKEGQIESLLNRLSKDVLWVLPEMPNVRLPGPGWT